MHQGPNPLAALAAHRRKFIVRGVNWLGDAVMTTPALLRLREAFPEARISLLTPAKLVDLWRGHPAIDAVLPLPPGQGPWATARALRRGDYELGLVLPNSPRSALELWMASVPVRLGYAAHWRRWWLTHPLPPRPEMVPMRKRSAAEVRRLLASGRASVPGASLGPSAHHIHHYMRLVSALGANPEPPSPMLWVSSAESEEAARRFGLDQPAAGQRPWLGLNPGAEYGPAKRWPLESFAAAAAEVSHHLDCRWVILGGRADQGLAARLETELRSRATALREGQAPTVVNLAGKTRLRDLCAVLRLCRVLLTNDTGPMHVAAALGTPVVAPFGSTSPELTGPGLPEDHPHSLLRGRAPCAPCFRRACPADLPCLTSITPAHASAAILAQLQPRGQV